MERPVVMGMYQEQFGVLQVQPWPDCISTLQSVDMAKEDLVMLPCVLLGRTDALKSDG
jgi:hypothetical protein